MSAFEQLSKEFPSRAFPKGETLLLKNEIPQTVYILERGLVEAYTITPDGAERQIAVLVQGDDIPVGFGIRQANRSEYFYRAYSNCVVRQVPPTEYIKLLRSDIDVMFERCVQLDARLMLAFARISALEHPRAGDKVAFLLMSLSEQVGTRLRPYKTRFRIAMTQQELADSLGLTRETTGIELKKLEVLNLLSHSRKNYILYVEQLRQYLEKR